MAENEEYCIDTLHQTIAVKQALSGIEDFMLENYLKTHVSEQMQSGQTKKQPKKF